MLAPSPCTLHHCLIQQVRLSARPLAGASFPSDLSVTSMQLSSSTSLNLFVNSGILPAATATLTMAAPYILCCNLLYLARRSHLRKTTMMEILKIRTTREVGFSRGMFCLILLAWQLLVALYPLVEPVASVAFGYTFFFYSYPNANGAGYILEPLNVQHLRANQRTKTQFRLDWHRFKYNVGEIGRDGYRHPPSRTENLPHIDFSPKGIKHWPWRRRMRMETKTQ